MAVFQTSLKLTLAAVLCAAWSAHAQTETWNSGGIGTVSVPGSSTYDAATGRFTIKGAGTDIGGTADSFHYVSQPVSGDARITARVVSQQNTNTLAKAGLMFRQSLSPGSADGLLAVTPGSGLTFVSRLSSGATAGSLTLEAGTAPVWLSLLRSGPYLIGYRSADGITWNRSTAVRVPLTGAAVAGMAVTSRSAAVLATDVFDNVTLDAAPQTRFGALPLPWKQSDVGTTQVAGSAAYDSATGTTLLTGAGSNIWGTADGVSFLSRSWYGDGTFIVRVLDIPRTADGAKAAIMIRESSAAGARNVSISATPVQGALVRSRATTGGDTAIVVTDTAFRAPGWLKLERLGDRFTAFTSTDGITWKQQARFNQPMSSKVEAGLAVTSQLVTTACTAMFDHFSATGTDTNANGLPDAWELATVGHFNSNAAADSDNDGLTNLQEFTFGSNPLNATSILAGVQDGAAVAQNGVAPFTTAVAAPVLSGLLEWSVWTGIAGDAVSDLTSSATFSAAPAQRTYVSGAAAPVNYADSFGQRLRGLVTAPVSGSYTFYIASNNAGDLLLGSSASRFTKRRIASVATYTNIQDWTAFATQKSLPVTLVAGQQYWIEALSKDGSGSDHLEIGWKYPGQAVQQIPGTYLCAPVRDSLDLNDDGLPDSWALANQVSGEWADPDHDGVCNLAEYQSGGDPRVFGGAPGYLSRDVWYRLPGYTVSSLTRNLRFLSGSDYSDLWAGASYPLVNLADAYAQRLRGTVTAPVSGEYTFLISGDNNCELWLSSDERKFQKRRIAAIEGAAIVDGGAGLSAPVTLQAGSRYYLEILHKEDNGSEHVEVSWEIPGGVREIIPAQYLNSFTGEPDDLDGDDLPDSWERLYGLDPADNGLVSLLQASYGDFDGDGLTNREEYLLGTNPASADTDGDGIRDSDELYIYGSNPLVADVQAGAVTASLNGTAVSAGSAGWYAADDVTLVSTARRGWVEYQFTTAADGRYLFNVHGNARGSGTASVAMPLRAEIDGIDLGAYTIKCGEAVEGVATGTLPWLKAGSHLLRIHSENTLGYLSLQINSITINATAGIDANGNALADWIENALVRENEITRGGDSAVSPLCLEGHAAFPGLVELNQDGGPAFRPLEGVDHHWYKDIELNPAQPTQLTVSFENGARQLSATANWLATNVLQSAPLILRKNDSLRLTAFPGAAANPAAQVQFTIGSEVTSTTADAPLIQKFTQAGNFTITAVHTLNGVVTSGTLSVKVLAADFGPDFPVYMGRSRLWTLPGVPAEAGIESDSRVYLLVMAAATGRAFQVDATQTGDLHVLARVGKSGPVLARGTVSVMKVASTSATADTSVVYTYENGDQLVRMGVVADGLPPGGYVQLDIFAAGVTFEDGTRSKLLYAADFDENGVAYVVFNYPSGVVTSVCHRLYVYDSDGALIGAR